LAMLKFVESFDGDKRKFAQLFYKQFFIDGKWQFGDVTKLKGYPEGLNTENLEIYSVGDDYVCFIAGGDWQKMTVFDVKKSWSKNALKVEPFYDHPEMNSAEVKTGLENLIKAGSVPD
jgi:hypothetical protein